MPGFDEELQQALGGGGSSFDDELNAALGGGYPQVGVTLEGLDAERAAAEQSAFKPWSGPAQVPLQQSSSAGAAKWGTQHDPEAGLWESVLEGGSDFGQRAAQSATFGYGDEIVGALAGEQRGQAVRDRQQLAQERSPGWSLAGDVAGGLGMAAATGGIGHGIRGAAATGALEGGLAGAGYADDGDRLEGALQGAGAGAALGGAGGALGAGASGAASWVGEKAAPWLREQGLLNRVASSGLYGGSMDRLAQNQGGKQGVAQLGEWMENHGLTQWTPEGIGDEAASMNSMWQGDQRAFIDDLAGRPEGMPMVDTGAVGDKLRREAGQLSQLPDADSARQVTQYRQEAEALANKSEWDQMPFDQALRARQGYDKAVNWDKLGGSREDGLYEEVARDAGNGLRGGLVESLENTSPELAPRWESIQENLGNSATIAGVGNSRAMREFGNQPLSLPSLIGAAGGGFPGMVAAAAVKTGGRAGAANVLGGASKAANWIGDMAGPAGAFGDAGGAIAAQEAGRDEGQQASRGFMLPQAAMQLLQSEPQALGPYQKQFADAAASPDSGAVKALLTKLRQSDETWRTTYLPKLQMVTGELDF